MIDHAQTIGELQAENRYLHQQLAAARQALRESRAMLHGFREAEDTLQRRNAYLTALHRITLGLLRRLNLDDLLHDIVTQAALLANTDHGYIYMLEPGETEMRLRVGIGVHAGRTDYRARCGIGVAGVVWQSGETLVIDNYRTWAARPSQFQETRLHSVVGVPLISGTEVIGVIGLTSLDEEHTFGVSEVQNLERFAQLASIALDNVRLYTFAQQELAERKRTEQALQENQTLLQGIIDNSPAAIYVKDTEGNLILVNRYFEKVFGCDREQLIGRNRRNLLPPDAAANIHANDHKVLKTGKPVELEEYLPLDDGLHTYVSVKFPLRDSAGTIYATAGISTDITTRKQVEEQLRMMERAIAAASNGIVISDVNRPDIPIIYCNPAFERITGYGPEDIMGRNCRFLQGEDRNQQALETLRHAIKEGQSCQVMLRNYRKDGTLFWNELSIAPIHDDHGRLTHYIGVQNDITERKRAEEALRESEQRFRDVVYAAGEYIWQVDTEWRYTFITERVTPILGFCPNELLGRTPFEFMPPDDADAMRTRFAELVSISNRCPFRNLEHRSITLDGQVIWQAVNGVPMFDTQGNLIGYRGTGLDITERKQVEEHLQAERNFISAVIDTAAALVMVMDCQGYIVRFNNACQEVTGYTPTEVQGRPFWDVLVPCDNAESVKTIFHRVRTGQTSDKYETFLMTKDARQRVIAWSNATLQDAHGKVEYVISTGIDVTERKQALLALKKAKEDAEAANRAKSVFLSNMSHELRTPLNAILGFSQLMIRDNNLDPEHQENLNVIGRSGEHLLSLINDVLEMSKIEAGGTVIHEHPCDLYQLLDDLEELFAVRAADKKLQLIFDRSPVIPRYVRTDQSKLRQVLTNLLSNAIKFTNEGGVTLRVSARSPDHVPDDYTPDQGDQAVLCFEIEDTGVGIAPEEYDSLFQPFTQTKSGLMTQQGTGLGLPISRQFVRLMGGDITVSSEAECGSVFRFDILVALSEASEVQQPHVGRRVIGLSPHQRIYRILVIEDERTNRNLLIKLLEPIGFEVREATNGENGIRAWEVYTPDLILMDMRMPVMDGYEATRRIKATFKGRSTPIIALTASVFQEERASIMAAGCDDLVRKPFREDELFTTLEKHLGLHFVYAVETEEKPKAESHHDGAKSVLTAAALAGLPSEWVMHLRQAATEADAERILTLVDQICQQHPSLADALADLVDNFQFDQIMDLAA